MHHEKHDDIDKMVMVRRIIRIMARMRWRRGGGGSCSPTPTLSRSRSLPTPMPFLHYPGHDKIEEEEEEEEEEEKEEEEEEEVVRRKGRILITNTSYFKKSIFSDSKTISVSAMA